MKRVLVTSLILIVNFIIQSSLFKYISINSITPDTALIITISFAILRGDVEGSVIGFFSGLIQDIFFGRYIGLDALLYMLLGYFCGKPFKDFYRENYLLPFFMTAVGSIFFGFFYYVINFFFKGNLDISFFLKEIIFPNTAYNVFLSVPIYIFIYYINKKLEIYERNRKNVF